jgi:hypothetical protein
MPSTVRRPPRRLVAALAVVLVTAAAAVAGCAASSGAGAGSDPAALVPSSAPLYVEAVLGGDAREQRDAQAALTKILGTTDPRGEIVKLFDRGGVQFTRDVEPWLGERVGAAALTLGRRDGDKVVVAASRDDAAARAALGRLFPGAVERSYRDVSYRVDARYRGVASAVVGDAVVFGTENGLKAAIDASKGTSLAETDALREARSKVREERSGFMYVDVAGFLRQALGGAGGSGGPGAPGAQLAPFLEPVAHALPKTIAAALDAEPGLLRIDSAAFGNGGGFKVAASGADALAALPADAWLGLGVGEVGQTVNGFIDRVTASSAIAAVGVQALLAQAQQGLGLDIRRDLLGWMGDAGLYVAGDSVSDTRGALVVASKDAAATRRAVGALETLARRSADVSALRAAGVDAGFAVRRPGKREDLLVAAAGDRFLVATGRRALAEALSPGARLGDAPAFRDAASKLGGDVRPSFFLDLQRLSKRAGSKGGSSDHARAAREYLGAFGAVVGGARRDGDVSRGAVVATLR